LNKIVHDKTIKEHDKVEGAIVLTPKIGLHEWVGSVDINSLYPNVIRSLNISPEKIIGQFCSKEEAWSDIRSSSDRRHTLILESGEQHSATGAEWSALLEEHKWAVSAYGTVFDQSSGNGVIADILQYWYSERKRLQAEKKKWGKLAKEEADPVKRAEYEKQEEQFDLLQLTKKISMNSLYGALLNVAFRYGDERMGASVTATGRQITTHMIETMGELLTGERHTLKKTTSVDGDGRLMHEYSSDSPAIIYGDTDSVEADTAVKINGQNMTVEDAFAFLKGETIVSESREFKTLPHGIYRTPTFDPDIGIVQKPIKAIYRHRVSKKKWRITLENGKSVVVTQDHSIMIERDGVLMEICPSDINTDTDICISIGVK
jgi:DNA polymerase elongation subunit (family B)